MTLIMLIVVSILAGFLLLLCAILAASLDGSKKQNVQLGKYVEEHKKAYTISFEDHQVVWLAGMVLHGVDKIRQLENQPKS